MNILTHYTINSQYPEIFCFTSKRNGGFSKNKYKSLNLSPFTGDNEQAWRKNLEELALVLGLPVNRILIPYQTHDSQVLCIDPNFMTRSDSAMQDALRAKDAVITNIPRVCIGVTTADCVPVFLYDSIHKAIGVVHAGWKGSCARIVMKTIEAMNLNFGTLPDALHAVIGPSISAQVYEVGEILRTAFQEDGQDICQIFQERDGRLYLDLWEANKAQLVWAGLKIENIELATECTYSNPEKYFSARRDGIKSGRMYSGIFLK